MISYTITKKLNTKKIDLSRDNLRGCFGYYIQISNKKGIKILHGCFNSKEELIKNRLVSVIREANNAKITRKVYSNVPRCYGIKILKTEEGWRIGIVYQHLGNTTLEALRFHKGIPIDNDKKYDITRKINNILRRRGILHNDLHKENIMFFKGKYWVIDFSNISKLRIE